MPEDPQTSANQMYRFLNGQSSQPLYQLSSIAADQRVQAAGNVQLLGSQAANGATSVAIGFTKPADPNIDHFEVWVQRSAFSGENPYQVASVTDSPATFTVTSDQNTVVIAFIRTIQKNGLSTDLQASPTVTFNINISAPLVPAANITAGTLNASVILASNIAASQITAGTLGAGVILASSIAASQITAGTLSSFTFTSGTISASSLTLNLNGVTTTINNNSQGTGNAGIKVLNNTTSWFTTVQDNGVFVYDNTGTSMAQLQRSGNGGFLQLSHQTSGSSFSVNVGSSPTSIHVDGTPGFSGTVSPVSSITVRGGIVTNVT